MWAPLFIRARSSVTHTERETERRGAGLHLLPPSENRGMGGAALARPVTGEEVVDGGD
jgi:hypothetical protein